MANLRNLSDASDGTPTPSNGTAYLLIYEAVKRKHGLIHGTLHHRGESCAIGSYFDVHPKTALPSLLIDEVAMVNDARPEATPVQRRRFMLQWLRWRLAEAKMSGFQHAPPPSAR